MKATIPPFTGFVEIEQLDLQGNLVALESQGFNLVLNNFRQYLPRLLAPRIVTGRTDNSSGNNSWLDRRIALLGIGIGDGAVPTPTVKPEDPEDGRTRLLGGLFTDDEDAKQGLQGPIRRIPLTPSGPSEKHTLVSPINSFYLFKEVDIDGIAFQDIGGGGSEIKFRFTVDSDEYIGNIMEYGLYLGGGDATDDTSFLISGPDFDRVRLSRETAIIVARKTRNKPLEKTRGFKFRLTWRLRT